MRVIGGKYKSRVLETFSLDNVRPTADAVRENLFNILNSKIEGCAFLDLFSGTGAIGIEALSRGAKSVCFNDGSRDSVALIKKNLSKLNVNEEYSVSNLDALSFLLKENKKYDIIFIDPPYSSDGKKTIVEKCFDLLRDDGIIVLEDEKPFESEISSLIKYDERKYGRVYLNFFKKAIPSLEPCLFAGTFDPITLGHEKIVYEALKRYSKVYVAIGINNEKTPFFSLEERLSLLKSAFNSDRIILGSYTGYTVDYMKEHGIKVYVRGIRDDKDYKYEKKCDAFNKTLYPELKTEYIYALSSEAKISSTDFRKRLIEKKDFSNIVSKNVYEKIIEILNTKGM